MLREGIFRRIEVLGLSYGGWPPLEASCTIRGSVHEENESVKKATSCLLNSVYGSGLLNL